MARKQSKRKKSPILEYRRLSMGELHRRIEQSGDGGNARAAIDMAKECYRREPSAAHAKLLSEAYLRRARQLMEKGFHAEATVVLGHALALGQETPELLRLVFECSLRSRQYASALGVFERLRDAGERARARCLLADEAVACGEEVGRFCEPAIREDAAQIRRAFIAFERADDQAVAVELKHIGLRSPCADWKWVLRGLTAYAHRDEARARTCWDRAGSDGKAYRLASLLQSMVGETERSGSRARPATQARLLSQFGNPRLSLLGEIEQALEREEPVEVLKLCKRLLASLDHEERPAYARRLARTVCPALVTDEENLLLELPVVFGRLPEDPRCTRMLALATEDDDPTEAILIWYYYAKHLREIEAIPQRLRRRARGMIWKRMGDLALRVSPKRLATEAQATFGRGAPRYDSVSCYRESIKAYPDDLQVHEKLLETLRGQGRAKQAEQLAEAILKRWPKHVKSMLHIAKCCFERDAFRKAIKYFDRAREAEPFSAEVRSELGTCFLFSARRRLNKGNLVLARKDFEQAEALIDHGEPRPELYCKWAALEWRAGDSERAEVLAAKAKATEKDTLALYYQMAIELARADVPDDVQDRFDRLLADAWRGKPTAAGAVSVAELTLSHIGLDIQYARREVHHQGVLDYLKRVSKKTEFTEDQLLVVCRCLESLGGWKLLEDYARRATRKYPGNYHFPQYLGRAQTLRGQRHLPTSTRRLLERAEQQALQTGDLKAVDDICSLLDPVFGGSFSVKSIVEALVDAMPEGALPELLDELEAGVSPSFPAPLPRPRRPGRRRNRRPANQPMLFEDLFDPVSEAG